MNEHAYRKRQQGFSLLEVVIGIVIFVIGVLALAALQGSLTRAMADAKVRTTAVNIAERLIESQRGFSQLLSDTANPKTYVAYNDIVNSDSTVAANGLNFSIDMDVTDYYYQLGSDSFTTTAPTGAVSSDYKQVEVTVSWDAMQNFRTTEGNEVDLGSGDIVLTTTIPALVTSASFLVAQAPDGGLGTLPVSYTPGQNPDIVSLSLGDTKFKESLLPEPDVLRTDEYVETRFDVITYSQVGDSAEFLRREEFAAVSCECTLKAADAAYPGHRPVIWAGDEYVRGQKAVKTWGVSANNQQSPLCDTCCRDHHDGGTPIGLADHSDTAVNTYVPFKPGTEYINSGSFAGDHKHYNRPRNGVPVEVTSDGSIYVEACRLVRQDGFFRVAQDFRRENLNIFPSDFLVQQNQIDLYSGYLTGAAKAFADETSPNYETDPPCIGDGCVVSGPPKQGDFDTAIELDDGAPTEFPSWTTLPLGPHETQQLRSRGLYIDYLSYDLREVLLHCDPETEDADDGDCQSGDVVFDRTGSVNLLEMIPFFDVQMTHLNRWNETPNPNVPVDSTNEPLADDNNHSRGVISKSADGESTVVATGHRGNLGFTDTLPIDNRYQAEVTNASLYVHAGAYTPDISGTVISGGLTETVGGNPDIIITGKNGAQCGQTSANYSCLVPGTSTSPKLVVSGFGKKNIDRWVCPTSADLPIDAGATATYGEEAVATFILTGLPAGTDYNFVIQEAPCPGDLPAQPVP